jgi:rod shape-determining protein MreD
VRRAAVDATVMFFAVSLQLTLVDRLPLPGARAPDILLLVVVALGLTRGPAAGMLAGFFAGLCLDLTPPDGRLLGESALVLCLVGYGCGLLSEWLGRSAPRLLAAGVAGAIIGETLQAAVGLIVGDPGVSLPAVRQVLPAAAAYDVLLSPLVLSLVALTSGRLSARAPGAGPVPAARQAGTGMITSVGQTASFRPSRTRGDLLGPRAVGPGRGRSVRSPRLRLGGSAALLARPHRARSGRPGGGLLRRRALRRRRMLRRMLRRAGRTGGQR